MLCGLPLVATPLQPARSTCVCLCCLPTLMSGPCNQCSSTVHCLRGRPHLRGPGRHQGSVCKDGALSQAVTHAHQHEQTQDCPQWSAAT